jgi:acetylornithine deacetylase/succinyl-diaminopimelate desuccinylase-like protein
MTQHKPPTANTPLETAVGAIVDENFASECDFLAALVRVPTDNPPGDCAAHAKRARELLQGLGFTAEAHPVPAALVRSAGMVSAVNLIVRQRFGEGGPCIALNAHGDVVPPGLGWTREPYGAWR